MSGSYEDMVDVYDQAIKNKPFPRTWGFFIWRTTYKDENLWNNYLAHIQRQANLSLSEEKHASELMVNLDFTVMEDEDLLGGASKEKVRELFRRMIDHIPEEGDPDMGIPPANERDDTPRYTHCIYVDDECLESYAQLDWDKVAEIRESIKEEYTIFGPDPFAIVLDCQDEDVERFSRYAEDDLGPEEEEEKEDMSWMPVECRLLTSFYTEIMADYDPDRWESNWHFCNPFGKATRPWRDPLFGDLDETIDD